ncbi:DUF3375 domain-containing protein [Lonepinella sp. BR2357]|uniref:DUF3375 domain-containing protein n=1 Tax=Lonepinella sp. BR2357 TaxID=3434549 RepID=UPI003F6DE998
MSFQSLQAKYKIAQQESRAWALLRADNAPYILAFLDAIFADYNEISYGEARLLLDSVLERSRELGTWETQNNATTYLNQWIRQGWLREMDDLLTKTDSAETALRFCRNLHQRASNTTASHLRIVQEAVRELVVALSDNSDDRIALLENKKADIQREIDAINAGVIIELDDNHKRERIREIYQLASLLTADFRHLEEEIRQFDQSLRIAMISDDSSRGAVLQSVMDKEELLAKTEAGGAFEGFFQLLCDPNRATELREQLRQILAKPDVASHLADNQARFLGQLMNELNNESQRVFRVRRRTEQELRSYIESGQAVENQAVDRLLSKLEKIAVNFSQLDNLHKINTTLSLPTGTIQINSPTAQRLKLPSEKIETDTTLHQNSHNASDMVLASLETVKIGQVAEQIFACLKQSGALSVAGLVECLPINAGLEELVAFLRVAKAVNAPDLGQRESCIIHDKNGERLQVSIPMLLLSVDLFPTDLNELPL